MIIVRFISKQVNFDDFGSSKFKADDNGYDIPNNIGPCLVAQSIDQKDCDNNPRRVYGEQAINAASAKLAPKQAGKTTIELLCVNPIFPMGCCTIRGQLICKTGSAPLAQHIWS